MLKSVKKKKKTKKKDKKKQNIKIELNFQLGSGIVCITFFFHLKTTKNSTFLKKTNVKKNHNRF